MKKIILTLLVLSLSIIAYSQNENPFAKFGYDVLVATSSKGEFIEFHDQTDIVEIGSVLFNRHTKEIVKILDKDETTIDISSATAAMSIDPHCEKYYWISPYAYAMNNPIKFIDPDGRDIKIYYQQGGKNYSFVFNGSNYDAAPKNAFVQNTLTSYKYNTENGGGESMYALANNGEVTVKLAEAQGDSYHSKGTVFWNTKYASKTAEGHVYSPATILEHEMDHAKSFFDDSKKHTDRRNTPDKQYGNMEERRVITGSEAKTAQANGEFPKGYVRTDHNDHGDVRVSNPTKTTPMPTQPTNTQQNNSSLWERFKKWWNE